MLNYPALPATLALLPVFFPAPSAAFDPPAYDNFHLVWSDTFTGAGGSPPDPAKWNVITGNLGINGEQEVYTSSSQNVQLSGGNTLQLIPRRNASSGEWTSARLESTYVLTPQPGNVTFAEAELRFGTAAAAAKQGIWPAWWLLGDSIRARAGAAATQTWPQCGELDVLETVNGAPTAYGTAHCAAAACHGSVGNQGTIAYADQTAFSKWRVQWDRSNCNATASAAAAGDWQGEKITWSKDGQLFHQITGAQIADEAAWAALCHDAVFFILNVAVGGAWPGAANNKTMDGFGSMMEVSYVAHYST